MSTQEAIAVLTVKKLSSCNNYEFAQALDIAIDALKQQEKQRKNTPEETKR